MDRHLTLTFGIDKEYSFMVREAQTANLTQEQARQWIDEEYTDLEPDMPNPLGKVLFVDKFLAIVKAYGHRPFASNTAWAKQFARCAGMATGKRSITIDVVNNVVGF